MTMIGVFIAMVRDYPNARCKYMRLHFQGTTWRSTEPCVSGSSEGFVAVSALEFVCTDDSVSQPRLRFMLASKETALAVMCSSLSSHCTVNIATQTMRTKYLQWPQEDYMVIHHQLCLQHPRKVSGRRWVSGIVSFCLGQIACETYSTHHISQSSHLWNGPDKACSIYTISILCDLLLKPTSVSDGRSFERRKRHTCHVCDCSCSEQSSMNSSLPSSTSQQYPNRRQIHLCLLHLYMSGIRRPLCDAVESRWWAPLRLLSNVESSFYKIPF